MAAETKKDNENTMKIVAGVAIVIILVAAAYFGGLFGKATPVTPQPGPVVNQLQYGSTQLLLASYDAGAALNGYSMAYATNNSGAIENYQLMSNQNNSFVRVDEGFVALEGFFGQDNSTDVLCMTYTNQTACAPVGQNTTTTGLARRLMAQRPAKSAFLAQKALDIKLINVGAIKMNPAIINEQVGPFNAKKVEYDLDYSNLTVQAITTLGITPGAPTHVVFWIDSTTGLVVKILALSEPDNTPIYAEEYSIAQPYSATLPARPTTGISTDGFVQFYNLVGQDLAGQAKCAALSGSESDACYKALAASNYNLQTCAKIKNASEQERCVIIVAQGTADSSLCANLSIYPDDCYISVVGENGNSSLCNNLKNSSLGPACIAASTAGKQKQAELLQQYLQQNSARNCAADSDCEIAGNSNQYCVPKNANATYLNETSPLFSCLQNVTCGCNSGFCGFAKNQTYYDCTNQIEDQQFKAYIEALAHPANGSNTTGANSS